MVAILKKGTTLSASSFPVFLSTLNTGIQGLAKKSAYVGNQEVQNIIGYLVYEISDAEKTLAVTNGAFYDDIATIVNTSTQAADGATKPQTTTPTTQTPVTQAPPTTPTAPTTCSGNLPSGPGVTSMDYATSVPGPVTRGTTWMFQKDTQQYGCTWSCISGYDRDGNNGCKKMAPGSGDVITVINAAGNTPIAGVQVEVIRSLGYSTMTIYTLTTDSQGKTPEFYLPEGVSRYSFIYSVTKGGLKITGANGCQSRITQGFNYCDSPSQSNVTITMGSNTENTLTLSDSSLSYGSIVGYLSTKIGGGEPGLLACTGPASNPSACDNPSVALSGAPEWTYDASSKTYSASLDISHYGWPHQEYRTCLKNPGQSVQCFNFTPRVAGMDGEIRMNSSNGVLKSIYGYIRNVDRKTTGCTQLASDGECNPTTPLDGNEGWSYSDGVFTVSLPDVASWGAPKAEYISCYQSTGQ